MGAETTINGCVKVQCVTVTSKNAYTFNELAKIKCCKELKNAVKALKATKTSTIEIQTRVFLHNINALCR